jgi:iron complex transport system ATP-binding protein
MRKIIELKNVTAYRGDTLVFENLSLDLFAGRNTAILGPNGAGKSTLLKLLTRDIYPRPCDDGFIKILGKETWDVWELRDRLGIVSHDLQLQYTPSALGINIVLSGFYASIDVWPHQAFTPEQHARAERIVVELGVSHLRDVSFASMSTGEQRRFLLGRALVNNPDTLVLDEPTSGLDLKACFQYLDVIRGLMRAGKTVLLVTHHIHEIPPEISHVILLKDGRVVGQGDKPGMLSSARLGELYGCSIEIVERNGFYQAVPGWAGIS